MTWLLISRLRVAKGIFPFGFSLKSPHCPAEHVRKQSVIMAVCAGADMLLLDGNRADVREQIRHEVIGLLTHMAPVIEKEQL